MDSSTHQLAVITNPGPSPVPSTPPAVTLPEEATGDSDAVVVSVRTPDRSSETDDDAESCSGSCSIDIAKDDECEDDEFEDDVAMKVDVTEVDSKMAVPWWCRTGEYAATGAGGCAPAAAAEGGRKLAGGDCAAAESNRLFWEACIAHGY